VTGESTTAVARKQLCGHAVSPTTREQAIMEETFSLMSMPSLYNEDQLVAEAESSVEVGPNTSTLALRVVGGDEK
jgi:hypothetical protein